MKEMGEDLGATLSAAEVKEQKSLPEQIEAQRSEARLAALSCVG